MAKGRLEHVNITVSDPDRTAGFLGTLLGWKERWRGPSQLGGRTIHIGEDTTYLAIYTDEKAREPFSKGKPMNHIGLLVDDLDAAEKHVLEHGLAPFSYGDYEPGRRFYFLDWDSIEFEVVSYE